MNIAIITGASSGMGSEFVRRIDEERLDELWLVARRKERLEELGKTLKTPVRAIAVDLTEKESIGKLKELLEENKPQVQILVNASGYGIFHSFCDTSLENIYGMIALNDAALSAVTYVTLPYMPRGSKIYNFGSLSAFQPVPYISVYGATKAYVLSLTRAMNVELRPRGIKAMAICPGWIKTEFFSRAADDDTISYFNRYYTPEQVVTRALYDMKRGKDVSICGIAIRAQVLLTKLLPHKLVMRIWCGQQKKPK